MAANPTPDKYSDIIAALKNEAAGMHLNEVALNVKQNTEAAILADRSSYIDATNIYNAAESLRVEKQATYNTAMTNGHNFVYLALGVLKPILGTRWNMQWVATGLPNQSVAIPTNVADMGAALVGLEGYFTANPGQEVAGKDLTAAEADTLAEALSTSVSAVNEAHTTALDKMSDRDAWHDQCKRRYRSAIAELAFLMKAVDPRWKDFGLNRPAAPSRPKPPMNVALTAMGPQAMNVEWDVSIRAAYYRIFYRVVVAGVTPPAFIHAGNSNGTSFLLLELTSGTRIEVTVSAANDAGESKQGVPAQKSVG